MNLIDDCVLSTPLHCLLGIFVPLCLYLEPIPSLTSFIDLLNFIIEYKNLFVLFPSLMLNESHFVYVMFLSINVCLFSNDCINMSFNYRISENFLIFVACLIKRK